MVRSRPFAGTVAGLCGLAVVLVVLGSLPMVQRMLPAQLRLLPQLKLVTSANLLPRFNERDIVVRWQAQRGTSLTEMERLLTKVTDELRTIPGGRGASAHAGRAVSGDQIVSVDSAQIWVGIKPSANYDKAVTAIRDIVGSYPGVSHRLETFISDRINTDPAGDRGKFVVRIYGSEFDELRAKAREVKDMLASVDGLDGAGSRKRPGSPRSGSPSTSPP